MIKKPVKLTDLHLLLRWLAAIGVAMLLMGMTIQDDLSSIHDPTEPTADFKPTKTTETKEINYRSLNLTGIFIKPDSRTAIIDGKVYHEGDAVGEYIITNIHVDTVELVGTTNNREVLQLAAPIKKAASIKEE